MLDQRPVCGAAIIGAHRPNVGASIDRDPLGDAFEITNELDKLRGRLIEHKDQPECARGKRFAESFGEGIAVKRAGLVALASGVGQRRESPLVEVFAEDLVLHDLTEWVPAELVYGAPSPYLHGAA